MKKLFALVALVLGVVSCQTDPNDLDVVVGGEREVMLNVSLPEATRSASNAGFDFTNFESNGNYDLRYILEIRYNGHVSRTVKTAESTSVSFPVRLAPGREYDFTVWADLVLEGSEDDLCYNTNVDGAGLTNITFKEWTPNNELRDAYYGKATLAQDQSITNLGTIELTRPFAKVRVISTDIADVRKFGIEPTSVSVKYNKAVYTSFNAVTGVAGTPLANQTVSAVYANAKYDDFNTAEATLFADYIFVPEDGTIQFSMDVKTEGDAIIKTTSFTTPIAVEKNKLTTIKGAVLTEGGDVTIKIENGLGELETINLVDTAEDLAELFEQLDDPDVDELNIELGGDIDLNDLLSAGILSTRATAYTSALEIPAGKSLVLDLKEHNLVYSTDVQNRAMIHNDGDLTIKSTTGAVKYTYTGANDTTYAVGNYAINNAGTLTIEGNVEAIAGTVGQKFSHAFYAINTSGTTVIKSGKILNNTNIAIRQWVGSEAKSSDIIIEGGEIEGLRAIWTQLPNSNTNLAPKGKITVTGGTITGTAIDGTMDSENILAIYSYSYGNQMKNVEIEISGGTFNGDIALTGGRSGAKVDVEKITITGGVFNGLWGDVYSYAEDALAKDAITIKGGEFSSIAPLVYLNAADEVVKLGKDIENAEPIVFKGEGTLNLNGKSVSAVDDTQKNYQLIDNRGKLAVVGDGTMTVEATINSGWSRYSAVIANNPGGNLTVNGATLEHLGGTDMAYGIDNLTNGKGTYAVTTIENATIKSPYRAVRQFLNGVEATNELYVKAGAKLEGDNKSIFFHDPNKNANTGKLVVEEGAELYGDVYLFVTAGSTEWPVEVSIVKSALKDGSEVISANTPGAKDVVEENGVYTVGDVVTEVDGAYEVASVAGLKAIAKFVNGGDDFKGKTIKLTADIDLNNENWAGIGTEEANFCGTFDGCNHTIKNLNILVSEGKEGKAYLGLFGYAKNATIKNVVFENVDINVACLDIDHSQGHIGAVAGSLEGTSTIENVTVQGDVKVYSTQDANGASRVAVVAGGNSYGNVTMKNVHVVANEGSYLIANNNTGALAGQLQGKSVFENCSSNIDVTVNKFFAGGIIGLAAGDQTFTNCHTTGNIAVVAGREGRAHDQYRVGGIAGGWSDGKNNVCTLVNCSYTGNVSGKNSDGSVANPLDYMGYVGRGYTLNGCQGSTVVIDGVRYVQKYDTAAEAGIYDVYDVDGNLIIIDGVVQTPEGNYLISKAPGMFWFANEVNSGANYFEGKTIKLGADIDLNNAEWTPIGSAYKDHGFMGNFDGNGKIIKNLKITALTPDADQYVYGGLFGVTEGVDKDNQNYIKNLVIENVNIDLDGHIVAAAIAYPYYTALENIKVMGNVSIKGGDYTSGVLAYTRRCVDAKNISIEANAGSVIEGTQTIGGVISDIQMNGGLTANYSNFKAENLTIKGTQSVGGISGIIAAQNLDGATVKNVTIVSDDTRKGTISGSFDGVCTIKDAVVENVTGADNYVGCLYSGTASDTSSVTINGDVYTYNNGWIVNGN
ncbi:MAG: hypothetical protein IKK05_00430 [Alistipes sp.]|nr:hypothetical protein [Alistipes sp.]